MTSLLKDILQDVYILTLNRPAKLNAFDEALLNSLSEALREAEHNPNIRVILIQASGSDFSAGADLNWMNRMREFSEAENQADALKFASILQQLYDCPKPVIALVQGRSFGGGIGLIAAADIAIASTEARFCFSELNLGLVPAVISPYVIKAIGERKASALFLSTEIFDAKEAVQIGLIHRALSPDTFAQYGLELAKRIALQSQEANIEAKALVRRVAGQAISTSLLEDTAKLIAKLRVSDQAQARLQQFLNRSTG